VVTPSQWRLTRSGHVATEIRPGVWVCCRCGAGARWWNGLWIGTMVSRESKCFDVEEE
jgi:hypothetical protein